MDLDEYRRTSHALWTRMAAGWDERNAFIEAVTRPVTERMIERLEPRPGQTILELAAGTGIVGLGVAAALHGAGTVILSDFTEAMVEAARRRGRALGLDGVEYRVLDAERLDVPSASVDGVVCRFGYMLMADPAAALAESRRVLREGGRLSCAVMGSSDDNLWSSLPARVAIEFGHLEAPPPGAPGVHALADPDRLHGLIAAAGFPDPDIEAVDMRWTFEDGLAGYWEFVNGVAGPVAQVLAGLGEAAAPVRAEIERRLEPFMGDEGLTISGRALVASATAA